MLKMERKELKVDVLQIIKQVKRNSKIFSYNYTPEDGLISRKHIPVPFNLCYYLLNVYYEFLSFYP
jgi:hypothetical protein